MVIAALTALLVAAATPVTVEIVASGHVETPAQKYRLSASLNVCAPTQAEADRRLAAKVASIDAALSAAGVKTAVDSGAPTLSGLFGDTMTPMLLAGFCGADSDLVVTMDGAASSDKPARQFGANKAWSLDAPSTAAVDKVKAILTSNEAKVGDRVMPMLDDEIPARRAAKQQALGKARAEADAYAGALGGGKAALVRISERQDLGDQSLGFMTQIFRTFRRGEQATDKVSTDVTLTVTFEVAGTR